ncbi:S8 family peptidase [Thalassotalea sp. G2M2-11]|uniref:S8 family peptidase n=1 Tax=Thalassotalea sp. G2M2-11 TaxID=2787627 RepID=UPI0019CF4D60|nr:S8 family peptidase [Thalassotalea sp. G2M2-11]
MLVTSIKKITLSLSLLVVIGGVVNFGLQEVTASNAQQRQSYIVSAKNIEKLQESLVQQQLTPTHILPIINAVAVNLTEDELLQLQQTTTIKSTVNHKVKLASNGYGWGKRKWQPSSDVVTYINATDAHSSRNFGDGITIGFLDTGLEQLAGLTNDLYGRDKFWGTYDAVNNTISNYGGEESGHGTHVSSIAVNSDYDVYGKIYGVAPNASIVGIKAFDGEGQATYADVIRGIDWALQVKDQINLRVLNMSFSGPVRSYYWDDPLNQAVMKAWQAGIVVVASSGNKGPEPMSIGVPGNVPYIITVGAMTDSYTKSYFEDDNLATFSSAGPTVESFVKPEIVAPGGHLSGLMAYDSQIVTEHPEFHDGGRYFEMSGTSQAAAVVSGVVALMLNQDPLLTPDDVKCRLMSSAKLAVNDLGDLAYSVFQQGAGVVDVQQALNSTAIDCANTNMDIAKDLAGEAHYYGPANVDENGNFFIEGLSSRYQWSVSDELDSDGGLIWKNNLGADGGLIWKNSLGTDGGLIWKNSVGIDGGLIWKNSVNVDGGLIWKNSVNVDGGLIWKNSVEFTSAEAIGVNNWVDQQ